MNGKAIAIMVVLASSVVEPARAPAVDPTEMTPATRAAWFRLAADSSTTQTARAKLEGEGFQCETNAVDSRVGRVYLPAGQTLCTLDLNRPRMASGWHVGLISDDDYLVGVLVSSYRISL